MALVADGMLAPMHRRHIVTLVIASAIGIGTLGALGPSTAGAYGAPVAPARPDIGRRPDVDDAQVRTALSGLLGFMTANIDADPVTSPCPFMPLDQLGYFSGQAGLTMSVREYGVDLFADEGFGIGVACGVDLEAALDAPDPAGPHAVTMEAWSLIDGTFAGLVADYAEEMTVAPMSDPALGGETASTCLSGTGGSLCVAMWGRGDLVLDVLLAGPGINQQQTQNLLFSMIQPAIDNLSAIGAASTPSTPPTVATVPPPTAPVPTLATVPPPTAPTPTVPVPTLAVPTVPTLLVPTLPAPTAPPPTAATVPAPTAPPTVATLPPPTAAPPTVATVPSPTTMTTTAPSFSAVDIAQAGVGLALYNLATAEGRETECAVDAAPLVTAMSSRGLVSPSSQFVEASSQPLDDLAPGIQSMFCFLNESTTAEPDASLSVYSITDLASFDEVLAYHGAAITIPDVPVVGGQMGSACSSVEDDGTRGCFAIWHRDGLVVSALVSAPAEVITTDLATQILSESLPAMVLQLMAYGTV